MSVLLITVISCGAMVCADFAGVYLNVSENRGRWLLAGFCDMGLDGFSKLVLTAYGFDRLTHHGTVGWLCCIPVLITGFATTALATKRAQSLTPPPPETLTGNRRAPGR